MTDYHDFFCKARRLSLVPSLEHVETCEKIHLDGGITEVKIEDSLTLRILN